MSNRISKYEYLDKKKKKMEKMWHLKFTSVPVIEGTLGIIQKGKDKHIIKTSVYPNL